MKNATIRIPAGGCSTNVDTSADFPAHAGALHHTYGPRPGSVQYTASSRNSAPRPKSSGGAIRSTCLRYADRTATRPGPTLTMAHSACTLVVPSPVEAIPLMSPSAEIDRFPGPDDESPDCPAQDAPPNAARAATATPSPAATTHRSAPDFSHNGSSNAPHTHRLTPNAATVTTTVTSHLPARLIVSTPARPSTADPRPTIAGRTRIRRITPHVQQSRGGQQASLTLEWKI